MARISSANPELDEFSGILAHRPKLADALEALHGALREDRVLPDRLLELVRLRVAFWNQCRPCMATRFPEAQADGLTEAVVCSLERPQDAADLTDAERAAIAYADLMATDHLGITDETFAELRKHFTDAQVVELGLNVAFNVGIGRFTSVLELEEGIPANYKQPGRVGPWDADEVVIPASIAE